MMAGFAVAALAQEPPAYEVTVFGEVAIRDARATVVRAAEAAGWGAKDREELVVLQPPSAWMGRAKLTNDGDVVFGRPVLALASVEAQVPFDPVDNANLSRSGPTAPSAGPRFWFLPSRRVLDAAHERLLADIDDELQAYQAVIRATRQRAQSELPPPPPRP